MVMRSTSFDAIVSPRGTGKRRGALAKLKGTRKFAEGGSVDYSDPDAAIAALNRSLNALAPADNSISLLNAAAGFNSPTRSGSMGENVGKAYAGYAEGLKGNRDYGLELAKLRMQAPTSGLQAAGLAQNLKLNKAILDANLALTDTPGSPAIGIGQNGKTVAAPPGAGIPPIGTPPPPIGGNAVEPSGAAAPRAPVQVAPLQAPPVTAPNPGAAPGAPNSTLTADPNAPGAALRPVATAPQQPQNAAMTTPSLPNAQPVPTQLAQQYATTFNRMVRASQSPFTLDKAKEYNEQLKALVPTGFAFLPDGSGIVPVGDKDPGYLAKAAAAQKMLVQNPQTGRYDFAPGVVSAEAGKAGAIAGSEAAARQPFEFAKIVKETTEKNKYETVNVPINGREIPMSRLAYKQLWDAGGMAGQIPGAPAPAAAPGPVTPGSSAAGGIKFGQNPGEKELSTGEGKEVLEGRKQAEDASATQRGIVSALGSIEKFPTNAFGEARGELGNYLRSIGADKKAVADWMGSTEDYQILQKDFFKIAADRTRQLGSREPGFVLQSFQRASPNVELLTDANKFLLHSLNQDSQYLVDMGKAREDWFTQKGNLNGFVKDFQLTHPPERYVVQAYVDSGNPVQMPKGDMSKRMFEFVPPGGIFENPQGQKFTKNADGSVSPAKAAP